jgi:hypothetical protein
MVTLMGHLTMTQGIVLLAIVLGAAFMWARSRDRRGVVIRKLLVYPLAAM